MTDTVRATVRDTVREAIREAQVCEAQVCEAEMRMMVAAGHDLRSIELQKVPGQRLRPRLVRT